MKEFSNQKRAGQGHEQKLRRIFDPYIWEGIGLTSKQPSEGLKAMGSISQLSTLSARD